MFTPFLCRWLARAGLLAAIALIGPALAAAQQLRAPPKSTQGRLVEPYRDTRVPRARVLSITGTVTESEPNDSTPIANGVALGDTISGTVDPTADVDFFAFDLVAGTRLVLDVDAAQFGSSLDPVLGFFDVDGRTLLALSDDWDGLDSHIELTAPATGRYFAGIVDYSAGGGSGYFYQLKIVEFVPPPPGPGDPTTLFAQGMSYPLGMAAAANGDLFVADLSGAVYRVNPAGQVSTLSSSLTGAQDIVVDSYGDLLVAANDSGVWRVTTAGVRSRFLSDFWAITITVDAGGDVWIGGQTSSTLEVRRYDSRGRLRSTIDVGAMDWISDLAFSPAGALYASNSYDGIFRISTGGPSLELTVEPYIEGLAFDADGFLYVANGYVGEVLLFNPSLQPVGDVFARTNLGGPINLVFGRTSTGAMTSRLFAANAGYNLAPPFAGGIVEMNPAAMRAAGFPIGTTRPEASLGNVADAFLGESGAVSTEVQHFLDLQGNGNGRLDVADFRTYLRSLTAPATTAGRNAP